MVKRMKSVIDFNFKPKGKVCPSHNFNLYLRRKTMRRKSIIIWVLLLSFFPIITPAHALVVSSDPFDETDHYAILLPTPDGAITQIQAKVKAPDQISIGPGEIWLSPDINSHRQRVAGAFIFLSLTRYPSRGLIRPLLP